MEESKKQELLDCDLWNHSGCCTARFLNETDICSACKEHASPCCDGCEDYIECGNPNKRAEI